MNNHAFMTKKFDSLYQYFIVNATFFKIICLQYISKNISRQTILTYKFAI